MKCRYIEGSKNGPVLDPFGHGPVTGPYGPVNFYLCMVLLRQCIKGDGVMDFGNILL